MTKSGITRRIDELGRIVVPKEMRVNLGIRDGEPLEIYIDNNSIVIKKYSQVENIKDIGEKVCSIISDICNVDILISDREKIIISSRKVDNLKNTLLEEKLKLLIDNRESKITEVKENILNMNKYFVIVPIITSTDCSGLIFIVSEKFDKENLTYAKIVEKFISQKLDIS